MNDAPIRLAHRQTIEGLLKMIPDEIPGSSARTASANLRWMMYKCITEINSFPVDKIGRWVGFVQGVLALSGNLNVDEERERTRSFFHRAYAETGQSIPESSQLEE